MNPSWIAVIGTLSGVVVAGALDILRAKTSFRREKSWEHARTQRQHVEAAYEAFESLREAYAQLLVQALYTLKTGSMPPESDYSLKVPWARLRMMINLYLPELLPELDAIEKTGPEFGKAATYAMVESPADGAHKQSVSKRLLQANQILQSSIDAARDALVALSESLVRESGAALGKRNFRALPRRDDS